ncbi:MAG TPA: YicC family protein [Porphyromonadaceae bacterium]|nr:YicC family protein [Muribaculaceae bacterium Isolate-013 (NCI)]HAP29049.1 YicC family protein [Porphyromonadaceae bacterium]
MVLSMTGFGSAVVEFNNKKFTFEVKSLNSKQLDLTMRVPAGYRSIESDMRAIAARRLERGKAELTMYVENIGNEGAVQLNVEAMAAYKAQIMAASERLGIPEPSDWYSVLLRFSDTVKGEAVAELSDDERAAILDGVSRAVEQLMEYRAVEGKKLDDFFRCRIARITELLAEVPRYESERVAKIYARIEEGLKSIPQVQYDKGRLEQEMIFYIEKLDVNEEKQRLAQHLRYFLETLDGAPGQGKKLGFISQEMGREINTLGSKSNHAEMQILVVKMKDELEQIKEQVLNAM